MFHGLDGHDLLSTHRARRALGLAALVLLLLLTWQAARSIDDPLRLAVTVVSTVLISLAWSGQMLRSTLAGIWLLGIGAVALVAVLPGAGAVLGIVASIVTAAMRLPPRQAASTALILGGCFLLAEGAGSGWSSPLSLALNAIGLGFAFVGSTSVRGLREERERAEALLAELERTRDAQIEAAALGERARIAREIHDVLAHTLSALAVQLQGTRVLLEQRPEDAHAALAAVERAHRLAREGLDETRRAVGALRGDRLPGVEQLARLADDFSTTAGPHCQFAVEGEPRALDAEAQLALYRTAQEALTNIHKHAQASAVSMRLRYLPDGAELVVEDQAPGVQASGGNGTRSGAASGSGGYGLIGMRERAELLGGTLDAGRQPNGFKVRLWLPSR